MVALASTALAYAWVNASPYDDRRAAAVSQCESIDPSRYEGGLFFNPDGYRSYYVRSECFQKTAVRFRDASLCERVKERPAFLQSSWGYSPANCRSLVAAGIEKDRRRLEEIRHTYLAGHMTLTDFRIELDNNGSDFDIVPLASGSTPGSHSLRFEVVPERGEPILLHEKGYFIDKAGVRIYLRRADIIQRVPDLSPDRPYAVRATMTYVLPISNVESEWKESFIETMFPLRERAQVLTKVLSFPRQSTWR
jgi:hypothetical protein